MAGSTILKREQVYLYTKKAGMLSRVVKQVLF